MQGLVYPQLHTLPVVRDVRLHTSYSSPTAQRLCRSLHVCCVVCACVVCCACVCVCVCGVCGVCCVCVVCVCACVRVCVLCAVCVSNVANSISYHQLSQSMQIHHLLPPSCEQAASYYRESLKKTAKTQPTYTMHQIHPHIHTLIGTAPRIPENLPEDMHDNYICMYT